MPRIRALEFCATPNGGLAKGEKDDVSAELAQRYIDAGRAELVRPPGRPRAVERAVTVESR